VIGVRHMRVQVMGVRGKYGKWLTGHTSTALATSTCVGMDG
jgi:hypothetical protein